MNNFQEELYRQKYLKYKEKYLAAKQLAGNPIIESDLRPGEGQEIGLVTSVDHPFYNVTNNHGTFRVKLRAGITHKLRKDGTQKEHQIEKNVTFVLIQPEVCDYGQGRCGDILKIYSPKEKKYLLDNQTRLIRKGFITERLYEGSHESNFSHGASNVVFNATKPIEKSSHAHTREFPSSDEDTDDEETMEIARGHQAHEHNFEHRADEHHLGHQADEHHLGHRADEHREPKKSKGRSAPITLDVWGREANPHNPYAPESHHMDISRSQSLGPSRHHQMSSHSVLSGEGTLVSRSADGSWTASVNLSGSMQEVLIPQRVIQRDIGRSTIYIGKAVSVSCNLDNGRYVATRVSSK